MIAKYISLNPLSFQAPLEPITGRKKALFTPRRSLSRKFHHTKPTRQPAPLSREEKKTQNQTHTHPPQRPYQESTLQLSNTHQRPRKVISTRTSCPVLQQGPLMREAAHSPHNLKVEATDTEVVAGEEEAEAAIVVGAEAVVGDEEMRRKTAAARAGSHKERRRTRPPRRQRELLLPQRPNRRRTTIPSPWRPPRATARSASFVRIRWTIIPSHLATTGRATFVPCA